MYLVFAESQDNKYKKSSLEAISYAKASAGGAGVAVFTIGSTDASELGQYGADKILQAASLTCSDPFVIAAALAEAANACGAKCIIISNNYAGKSIAPLLAVKLKAGVVSGVVALPNVDGDSMIVRKGCFSGKGFVEMKLNSVIKVLAITPNSYKIEINAGSGAVEAYTPQANVSQARTQQVELKKVTEKIPLTEAEVVVSGGRGWKGPENWGMVEELAAILGGATACSKPVSDMDWRPHEEHVGQTGITIKPNLYIATGISGAIQHQAGVSGSKVIVVINKDPEAPFFKIADYGIVGDVFEAMPKIIEAAKVWKAGNH